MSAGGPHNPKPIMAKHGEIYIPPIERQTIVQSHPYGYKVACCGECHATIRFASGEDAEVWADAHAARCGPTPHAMRLNQ